MTNHTNYANNENNANNTKHTNNTNYVPIWERYTLTIEEAAKYFRI